MTDGIIHIAPTEKRSGIPAIGAAAKCDKDGCPGPEGWEFGFGLAGGGYGAYEFCNTCGEVKGKNCEPDDEEAP